MRSLSGSQSLLEVTLDGNPVSDNPNGPSTSADSINSANQGAQRSGGGPGGINIQGGVSCLTYRQKLICQISNLRQLDMKRISVSSNLNLKKSSEIFKSQ